MLRIHQIKCPVDQKLNKEHIARKLHCSPDEIRSFEIEKESLDARGEDLHYAYTVLADVKNSHRYLKRKDVSEGTKEVYHLPSRLENCQEKPIIVGFGPSGMYAALILAECGLKPLVIERGRPVEERAEDIHEFFQNGILQRESNVQFGEGGAGTFSDGKLTTRMKNIRVSKVMQEFIEAGADPAIAYEHRPHLGTDVLRNIVRNIRRKILSLGGEVQFETKLLSIGISENKVVSVQTNHGQIPCSYVLLCAGHSASDTYSTLYEEGISMIQKDFACGVRVEHPQTLINENQYGKYADSPYLGAASYRLAHHSQNGRGVYSFCMCPGGQVIPASTEEGSLAVNGMSYSARDGKNANSAILVQVPVSDFDHGHPLDGFAYQKQLERLAYRDGYVSPAENIADYLNHSSPSSLRIQSSFPRGIVEEDMHRLFSEAINASLEEGFQTFDHKIPGFISKGIMVGMESRSSSPIRIPRNENGESISLKGLYPCGEGAGYAGGIVSSAVDGIKEAEHVIETIRKEMQ